MVSILVLFCLYLWRLVSSKSFYEFCWSICQTQRAGLIKVALSFCFGSLYVLRKLPTYLLHRRTVLVTLSAMLLPQDVVGTNFFDKRFPVISLTKKIAAHHRFREIFRKMEILILITPGQSIIRVIPDHTLQYNYVTSSHSVFFLSSKL